MKHWDIIEAPKAGTGRLMAWVAFTVARRKALSGKTITVRYEQSKPGSNSYGRDEIPF